MQLELTFWKHSRVTCFDAESSRSTGSCSSQKHFRPALPFLASKGDARAINSSDSLFIQSPPFQALKGDARAVDSSDSLLIK